MHDAESVVTFERLAGSAVENAAMKWVLDLERRAGRNPQDCRRQPGYPADIDSPPRIIEIKAVGGDARGADLPLEPAQVERARVDPDFYLYIVDNVAQGDPTKFRLRVFGGDQLHRLLSRVREKRYYVLPVPVAEYDSAPGADV